MAVDSGQTGSPHHSVINISGEMVILTWVMFAVTAFILHRIAWKPVMAALDKREKQIQSALEDAEQSHAQAEETRKQCEERIAQADADALARIEQARKTAEEAAESITNQAREDARLLLANAQREIGFQKEKALDEMRRESARLAVEIAGKLIRKNPDNEENRALTDEWINRL